MSIESSRHKGLRRLIEDDDARGVPGAHANKIRRLLFALQEATEVSDMARYPGWRLHPLKGDLDGLWSVTVTANWRIVFRCDAGRTFDVDLIDDH
ncbi:MAG: type II toxin-antitoxin system RelE/ParE family toxin [Geminicoccaceae bacterium]